MTTRELVLSMTVGELLAVISGADAPNTLEQLENAIGLAVEILDTATTLQRRKRQRHDRSA